jgi:sterol 14-demethylase
MEDHQTATIAHTWLAAMAIAVLPIVSVLILTATKMGRTVVAPPNKRKRPPVAEGAPLLGVLPTILTRSLQDVISDQYSKLGSVFTLSSLGVKVTFLVGPEVSAHFFHAAESEISIGDVYKVTVPIFGKGVGYDVDHESTTRGTSSTGSSPTL